MNLQANQTTERMKSLLSLSLNLPNNKSAVIPSEIFLPSVCVPHHEKLESNRSKTSRKRQRHSLTDMKLSSMIPLSITIPSSVDSKTSSEKCTCDSRKEQDGPTTNNTRWEDRIEFNLQNPRAPVRRTALDCTLCDPTPPKMPQRSIARRRHSDPIQTGGLPPRLPRRSNHSC